MDYKWLSKDLREQLGSAIQTLAKLRVRAFVLKTRLVHHVDQGQGLTHDQLVEVYEEIDRLFPHRVRKASDSLDVRL